MRVRSQFRSRHCRRRSANGIVASESSLVVRPATSELMIAFMRSRHVVRRRRRHTRPVRCVSPINRCRAKSIIASESPGATIELMRRLQPPTTARHPPLVNNCHTAGELNVTRPREAHDDAGDDAHGARSRRQQRRTPIWRRTNTGATTSSNGQRRTL